MDRRLVCVFDISYCLVYIRLVDNACPIFKDCHNVEFIWRYSDIVPQVITQLIGFIHNTH